MRPWLMHQQASTGRELALSQWGHGSNWGRQGQASQLEQGCEARSETVSRKVASVVPHRFPLAVAERTNGASHGIRSREALGRNEACRKSAIK